LERLVSKKDCDMELKTLINVLKDRNPEFRRRNAKAAFKALSDELESKPGPSSSFANIIDQLSRIDRSDAAWRCVEEFIQSLADAPVIERDVESWFNGVLALSLGSDAKRDKTHEQLVKMQRVVEGW
jgi:hypothetical protein